ncbi:hypothetical protein [Flavobacterium sp.]
MKTTGKQNEQKKAPVKATKTTVASPKTENSITDKSTARTKSAVDAKATAAKTTQRTSTATADAVVIKAPTRRKRIAKKITEIRSDIILHEHTGGMLNGFSILVGLFLLAQGIWGLQSDVVFNVFTTNTTHAVIHIVLGITALIVGLKQNAFGFNVFLGLLLGTVGVLRLIPPTSAIVVDLLNANESVAALNMTIGVFALLIAFTDTRSYHTVSS